MYQPTDWRNHTTDKPGRYNITKNNDDNTYNITRAGQVMQQGTPQDQAHFNHMEQGIFDAHIAIGILVNALRQQSWEIETGEIELTNTAVFPFNNSVKSVPLVTHKENGEYLVIPVATAPSGNIGEIVVTDRLTNGFKLAFTGSAPRVTVKYTVIGGYLK